MRRNDRAVTDSAEIAAFLAREQILRIGFFDGEEVYIVPVNYGYTEENGQATFWFHGAAAGRKYTLAMQSPTVGFEIDGGYALLPAETACGHSAHFQSVIGTGTLRIAGTRAEKQKGLQAVMRQATGRSDWEIPDAAADKTAVFRLDVTAMTCKAK